MRLPLRWLRDYLDVGAPAAEIAERLDALGFEVESVSTYGAGCKGLVVARVLDYSPHPAADRLRVCKVEAGPGEEVEVVCGASNFSVGDLVAFAPVGAELPGGLKVEARTIRGVTSYGMICSESELGVGTDAEGILVLERADVPGGQQGLSNGASQESSREQTADAAESTRRGGGSVGEESLAPGAPLEDVLGLGDVVIEVDVTPNRPDAMSVIGLARELASSFGTDYRRPSVEFQESGPDCGSFVSVQILEPDRCPRYIARYLEGIRVGASPSWMALRLREAGLRPINNVVDVTNFVLLEVGHPLHAFDYDEVEEGRIVVRTAEEGEELLCIDGELRVLGPDDLVIADGRRALALAGVIGGEESAISEKTRRVLLESAYFEPTGILRTAKRHGVRTESSARFERGCDPEGAEWASRRAASLMVGLCGAIAGKGSVDEYPKPIEPARIRLRCKRTDSVLGITVPPEEQARLLSSIELQVDFGAESREVLDVVVPTFRPDLTREIDLIEEIGRLKGYDVVPKTLPASRARVGGIDRPLRVRRQVSQLLQGLGFFEVKNFSLVAPSDVEPFTDGSVELTRVANPLRVEESVLRPFLLPGLLRTASYNLSRRRQDLRLCEFGTVFGSPDPSGTAPEHRAAGGIVVRAGGEPASAVGPTEIARAAEFYEAKGAVEAVLSGLGVTAPAFEARALPGMHPGRCATVTVSGQVLGYVAEVDPAVAESFGIEHRVGAFELDLDRLVDLVPERRGYVAFSRFPPVLFDLSFVLSDSVPTSQVLEVVRSAAGELLESCEIMDVYRSPRLGEGNKSVTVSIGLAALDRTLTDEEAAEVRLSIVNLAERELGARLREA